MRVLHLINAWNPGGIEMWLLRMLSEIPRDQVRMDVACKGDAMGPLADKAICHGAHVYHLPLRWSHTEFVGGIRRKIDEQGYDLVHNHLDVAGGTAVWAARRSNIPVISSFHNTQFAPQTWTRRPIVRQLRAAYGAMSIRYSLRHSAGITGCSRAVLDGVVPRCRQDDRCRILYYGVESHSRATAEERSALRASLGLPQETPLILHVGRFFAQKNHAGLLRIFAQVARQLPTAHLVLIGDGALRPEIERQIKTDRLQDRVHLLGYRRDVPAWMCAADVMLFPSFHEGLPVVSLEAAACGLPLVASAIPGTTESVVSGETGLLHAVDDENGMAESTIRLLRDPRLAARLQHAGWQRISEKFSAAASARSLVQLYEDTLAMPGKKRAA